MTYIKICQVLVFTDDMLMLLRRGGWRWRWRADFLFDYFEASAIGWVRHHVLLNKLFEKRKKEPEWIYIFVFLPLDKWRKRVLNTQGHRYDDDIFPRDKKVIESSAREREKGHRLVSLRLLSAAMMILNASMSQRIFTSVYPVALHTSIITTQIKSGIFHFEIFHNLMMV